MRRTLLLALALALVPAATGATGAKTVGTRGNVISISADGGRVAIHATYNVPGGGSKPGRVTFVPR